MSNEELIAEAEKWLATDPANERHATAATEILRAEGLVARLADALRELDVPAGWRVKEYIREDGALVWSTNSGEWGNTFNGTHMVAYPTAAAAMAAIEGIGQ